MEASSLNILSTGFILTFGKIAILLILALYAIFSLIIIRQVDLMGKTLITGIAPVVRALAIINAGLVIGLIVLSWGLL